MLFDEPEPAPQLLDLLPGGGDPLLERTVLSLEHADPLTGLPQLGAARPLSLALGQLLLRLETALPPDAKLFLERFEKPLQVGEGGKVRPCVR